MNQPANPNSMNMIQPLIKFIYETRDMSVLNAIEEVLNPHAGNVLIGEILSHVENSKQSMVERSLKYMPTQS